MGANTGVGLTPLEFYGFGTGGIDELLPTNLRVWTPNFTGSATITIPEITESGVEVTGSAFVRSPSAPVDIASVTDTTAPITNIGNGTLEGQIRAIRYDNIPQPRSYPMVVRSEEMPTGLVVRDELGVPVLQDLNTDLTTWNMGLLVESATPNSFTTNGTASTGVATAVGEDDGFFKLTVDRDIPERLQVRSGRMPRGGNPLLGIIPAGSGVFSLTFKQLPATIAPTSPAGIYLRTTSSNPGPYILNSIIIERVTDGLLTGFPASQPWVPVLGKNQGYLSNFSSDRYTDGVNVSLSRLTSNPLSGTTGSWAEDQPSIGSLIIRGVAVLQVIEIVGLHTIVYAVASGTDAEIQAAFEYPNVFDIDPFDEATEAYNGNFNNQFFLRGVDSANRIITFSSNSTPQTDGSYTNETMPVGTVIRARNGAEVEISRSINNLVRYTVISGTPEEIQEGFQWPNHFTVTPP